MDFLKANFLNTTGQISVNSNTQTASNMFNRDPLYQYFTDGMNNDLTTTVIQITFDATTPVSRISLIDINFKEFSIFYNGATANSFAITAGDTSASSYLNNADANKYFRFSTIQCSSITINAKSTITTNQEKVLGLFVISENILTLDIIPSARGYKPKIVPKQVVHKLSDGGTRIHNVRKKWDVSLDLDYISPAQRNSIFEDIYELNREFIFTPFGTATGWDAILFEAVWDGPFQFYEFSDNATVSGFSGKIMLKETPT